jgi:hypothetical protein
MANLVKGQWPAQDTKNILRSVRRIFETGDIGKLSKKAYNHITLQMGFIAHYNLAGFQDVYSDVHEFAKRILTSEYSNVVDYNRRRAGRYMADSFFVDSYGAAYCQSVCDCNIGIVELAEKYLHIQCV